MARHDDLMWQPKRKATPRPPRRHQLDTHWMADFRRLMDMDDQRLKLAAEGHRLLSIGDRDGARQQLEQAEELNERIELLRMALRYPNQQR